MDGVGKRGGFGCFLTFPCPADDGKSGAKIDLTGFKNLLGLKRSFLKPGP